MSTTKVIEIFPNSESAQKAYQYALKSGYTPADITVIMADNHEKSQLIKEENKKTLEEISQGGAAGGTIGGLLGVIAALGVNVVIPGIGFVIAGPLAGIVAGTLMGTLLALGLSETQASEYEEAINSGKIILCIDVLDSTDIKQKWSKLKDQNHYEKF